MTLLSVEQREEIHSKEVHTPKDPTILSSEPDPILGTNCVAYVRSVRPDAPSMNASDYPVSTTTPFVGAIGKEYYARSGLWHVFYVVAVDGDWLTVRDGNYDSGFITTRRIQSVAVIGYL